MKSYSIKVGPNVMWLVHSEVNAIWRHGIILRTKKNVLWQQRQRLEWCNYKPKNAKIDGHHQKLERGKEEFYPESQGDRSWSHWHLDFRLLASRMWKNKFLLSVTQFVVVCFKEPRKIKWLPRISLFLRSAWCHFLI